jgi:hypothetical protein
MSRVEQVEAAVSQDDAFAPTATYLDQGQEIGGSVADGAEIGLGGLTV